jgi:hypothetical protein
MSRPLFLLALSFVSFLVSARARAEVRLNAISGAYFGETIFHPGLRVGADLQLLSGGRHLLLAAGNVGGYHHRGNQTGLLADVELGYRYTFDVGVQLESRIGAGYLHTFLAGTTYERDASGRFEEQSFAGRPSFAPSLTVGLGYDWSKRFGKPIGTFLRLTAFEQFPFNHSWNPHLATQLGLSYQFGR